MSEASQCIQEASSIFPMSHHIMFMVNLLSYLNWLKWEFVGILL